MSTLSLGRLRWTLPAGDTEKGAGSAQAPWLIPVASLAFVGFGLRQRRADRPLIPRGALRARPAWGALVVSFFIGAALIAALVDIPGIGAGKLDRYGPDVLALVAAPPD